MLSELDLNLGRESALQNLTLQDKQLIKNLGIDLNATPINRAGEQIKVLTKLIRNAGKEFSDVILRRHSNSELSNSVFFSIGIYSNNEIKELIQYINKKISLEIRALKNFKIEDDLYNCVKSAYELGLKLDGGPNSFRRMPYIFGGEMILPSIFDKQAEELSDINIKIPIVMDIRDNDKKIDTLNGDIFSPEMLKLFSEKAFQADPIYAKSFSVIKDSEEFVITILNKPEKNIDENNPLKRLYPSKTEISIKKIYK